MSHKLSSYELILGQAIDPWTRGLQFTWIWQFLGLKWEGYHQFWFFRGTRTYYLIYVPFFWRNRAEFEGFEKTFIERATEPKGRIPQDVFERRADSVRAQLTLKAFQAPLLMVAEEAGGVVEGAATALGDTTTVHDAWKCGHGDEEACVNIISDFALKYFKGRMNR